MVAITATMPAPKPPLERQCAVCGSKDGLRRCTGCCLVLYCGKNHQTSHWREHKRDCKDVGYYTTCLQLEEHMLRDHAGDLGLSDNLFEEARGWFSELDGVHQYLGARKDLVTAMVKMNTFDSIQAAIFHCQGIVELDFQDYTGIVLYLPSLYLRLGLEQQCYDFCKWNIMIQDFFDKKAPDIPWGEMGDMCVSMKNSNVFEDLEYFTDSAAPCELFYLVAVMLVKFRLLQDLLALQATTESVGKRVPTEILDYICLYVVRPVVVKNRTIMESTDRSYEIQLLKMQVQFLFRLVSKRFKSTWLGLIHPRSKQGLGSGTRCPCCETGGRYVLQNSCDAWAETPGAIDHAMEFIEQMGIKLELADVSKKTCAHQKQDINAK
ncbi:hypothetical protein P152DRAFT_460068 [Eremomyces bilateralis CBS 781.70]|uniref:MYND-type domain-containing protein n=1 Tax=Eremomyces bilateralis CBS 781.70 TaxID=1392243 RepID=A0A6G1FYD4_9PEZI|nr:uncharacterized protein P152DRAFT_460068 [Eremomyces bilateralis CBS 781.70]KAF1810778.1 hypothetical protein P152DRAFT_460068 [Eremomyces bilateralis CBS 781.70]